MRLPLVLAALLFCTGCTHPSAVSTSPPPPALSRDPVAALQEDLARIFDEPRFDRAIWSVLVKPAGTSDTLFSRNASKLVMPGSNMKILVAAAAARQFGWNHRFETRVLARDQIEGGDLRGDLIVVGGGDPGISERSDERGILRTLAKQVRESGVSRIEGAVVGLDDLFDDGLFGDGWSIDNIPYGYSAGVTALEYNEGSVDLGIRAGFAAGDPVVIQVKPEGGRLDIDNRLTTVPETGQGRLTLHRLPDSPRLVVEGEIPARAAPFVRTASVRNPTEFFALAFRDALISEGIEVAGAGVDADDLPSKPDLSSARVLATRQSAPLSELMRSMMKVSQNQYAEILLRALGTSSTSAAGVTPGTIAAGRQRLREILRSWDVAADSYIVADGSGLSRYNYVTAETIVRLLDVMYQSSADSAPFQASLPIAGRDGTLARRFVGTPAEGRIRAKTGSVDNVRAISGYVDTAGGETLEFSVIANNFGGPVAEVDEAADAALVRLATFARSVRQSQSAAEASPAGLR